METSSARAQGRGEARRLSATLPLYAGTIFLSAFLLFGIQPMFAKMVLPKLGGSPGVWSVAMVFFQTMLLAGYGYAHWLTSRVSPRRAALVHIALMIAVLLATLPIGISAGFERPPQDGEILWLLVLFTASVGLPFFAVAANGPLLQAWFARTGHEHASDPYFLYAASNAGSFLALIAYPFAIEPFLGLSGQASAWAWGFAVLLAGITACAGLGLGRSPAAAGGAEAIAAAAPASARQKFGWAALAFVPSGLLVAVTAHISTDVAAAPLLWVAPLALFLATFVIVFQRKPVLRHSWMLNLQLVLLTGLLLRSAFTLPFGWGGELFFSLGLFFVTAMVAHGELALRRPGAANLTQFYLWMSIGGALGGLFSGLLAPVLFTSILEYPLLLIAGMLCRPGFTSIKLPRSWAFALAGVAVLAFAGIVASEQSRTTSVRSFFGVHRIAETDDGRFRLLVHGTTIHGAQRLLGDDGAPAIGRPEPLTYYYTGGGIAEGIASLRRAHGGILAAVAAVGVGTGSLACQAGRGEDWRYYEIDPEIVRTATNPKHFNFFGACAPDAKFIIGDARLTLADAADASLDLIIVDAFSSDAIPVHLLTTEAMTLYFSKLKPQGAVLLHISNRNMELGSVVAATAQTLGLSTWINVLGQRDEELIRAYKVRSHVALVARAGVDPGPGVRDGWRKQTGSTGTRPWSDDYADIISAVWRMMTR